MVGDITDIYNVRDRYAVAIRTVRACNVVHTVASLIRRFGLFTFDVSSCCAKGTSDAGVTWI